MHPTEYRYSKDHEWIAVEGDTATIGITDFAQQELGDVVFVELPEVGKTLDAGEVMGTIESVKAVSEIFAPVGGEILEINSALDEAPETLNADPHKSGWICRMRVRDAAELDTLMDAAGYEAHIAS